MKTNFYNFSSRWNSCKINSVYLCLHIYGVYTCITSRNFLHLDLRGGWKNIWTLFLLFGLTSQHACACLVCLSAGSILGHMPIMYKYIQVPFFSIFPFCFCKNNFLNFFMTVYIQCYISLSVHSFLPFNEGVGSSLKPVHPTHTWALWEKDVHSRCALNLRQREWKFNKLLSLLKLCRNSESDLIIQAIPGATHQSLT